MKTHIANIEFFEGLPSKSDLETWAMHTPGNNILILDDLMEIASKSSDIVDLFCQYSHHHNFTTWFICQNVFNGGRHHRTISLNCHYFVLYKNQRDELQIQTLGRQMFPGRLNYFMDAYRKATTRRYGYLLVDLSPHSDPRYKLRTNILPGQITTVFLPEKS